MNMSFGKQVVSPAFESVVQEAGSPSYDAQQAEMEWQQKEEQHRKTQRFAAITAVGLAEQDESIAKLVDSHPDLAYLRSERARNDVAGRDLLVGDLVAREYYGGDVFSALQQGISELPAEQQQSWRERMMNSCPTKVDGIRLLGELQRTRTEKAYSDLQQREAQRKADVEAIRHDLEEALPAAVMSRGVIDAELWTRMAQYPDALQPEGVRASVERATAAYELMQEMSHGMPRGEYEAAVKLKAAELKKKWFDGLHWKGTKEPSQDEFIQQARAEIGSAVSMEVDRPRLAQLANALSEDGKMDDRALAMFALALQNDAKGEQTIDPKFTRNMLAGMERWALNSVDYLSQPLIKSAAKTGMLYQGADMPPVYLTAQQQTELQQEVNATYSPDVEKMRAYVARAMDERLDAAAQADMLSAAATKMGTMTGDTAPILIANLAAPGWGGFAAGSALMFPGAANRSIAEAYAEDKKHPELVGNVTALFETVAEAGFGPLSKVPGLSQLIDRGALKLVGVPVVGKAVGAVQGNAALRYVTNSVIGESAGELVGENVISETGTYLTLGGLKALGMDLDEPAWSPFLHSWEAMQDARQTGATVAYCGVLGLLGVRGDIHRAREFAADRKTLLAAGLTEEKAARISALAENQREKAAEILQKNRATLADARRKAEAEAREKKASEEEVQAAGAAAEMAKAQELTADLDKELKQEMEEAYTADVLNADPREVRDRMAKEHKLFLNDVEAATALREGTLKAALREAGVLDVELSASGMNVVHLKGRNGEGEATERTVEWTDEQLAAYSQYALGAANMRRMKAIRSAALALDMTAHIDGKGYAETLPLTARVAPVAAALAESKGKMTLDVMRALSEAALREDQAGRELLPGVSNAVVGNSVASYMERVRWEARNGSREAQQRARQLLRGRGGAMAMRLPSTDSPASRLVYLPGHTRSVNLVEDAVESMLFRKFVEIGGVDAEYRVTDAGRQWLQGMMDEMKKVNALVKARSGRELMPGLDTAEASLVNVTEYFSHLAQSSFYQKAGDAGLSAEAQRHVKFTDSALVQAHLLHGLGGGFNAWAETEEGAKWRSEGGTLATLLQETGHEMRDLYESSRVTAENVAAVEEARRVARAAGVRSLDDVRAELEAQDEQETASSDKAAETETESGDSIPAEESAAGVELPQEVLGEVPTTDEATGEFELPEGFDLLTEPEGRGRGLLGGRIVDDVAYYGSVVGAVRAGDIEAPENAELASCVPFDDSENVFVFRRADGSLHAFLNAHLLKGKAADAVQRVRVFDVTEKGVAFEVHYPTADYADAYPLINMSELAFAKAMVIAWTPVQDALRQGVLTAEDVACYYADAKFGEKDLESQEKNFLPTEQWHKMGLAARVVRMGGAPVVKMLREGKASVADAYTALEVTRTRQGAAKFLEVHGAAKEKPLVYVRAYARAWEDKLTRGKKGLAKIADYVTAAVDTIARAAEAITDAETAAALELLRVAYESVDAGLNIAEAAKVWDGKSALTVVDDFLMQRNQQQSQNAVAEVAGKVIEESENTKAEADKWEALPPSTAWAKAPRTAPSEEAVQAAVLAVVQTCRRVSNTEDAGSVTPVSLVHHKVSPDGEVYVATDGRRLFAALNPMHTQKDEHEELLKADGSAFESELHYPRWEMVVPNKAAHVVMDMSKLRFLEKLKAKERKEARVLYYTGRQYVAFDAEFMADFVKAMAKFARVTGMSPLVEVQVKDARTPMRIDARFGDWSFRYVVMPFTKAAELSKNDYVLNTAIVREDAAEAEPAPVETAEVKPEPQGEPTEPDTEKKADGLTDAGRHIHARKDEVSRWCEMLGSALPDDFGKFSLSKHFPEPNYEKLLNEGMSQTAVALVCYLRSTIGTKPRSRFYAYHQGKAWRDRFVKARDLSRRILAGEVSAESVLQQLRAEEEAKYENRERLSGVDLTADAAVALGYPLCRQIGKFEVGSIRESYRGDAPYIRVVPRNNTAAWSWTKEQRTYFDRKHKTLDEAVQTIREYLNKHQMNEGNPDENAPKKKKAVALHVCTIVRKNERGVTYGIYHRLPGNVKLMLKRGFKEPKEAFNYLIEHRAELEEQTAAMKRKPNVEIEVTSERDGKDYRGGRNIDNAEFMETFGISGVTYGNWVNQAARQAKLNATYDALMDLAFVLGIPARAISLNGSLGVQFGASGKGKAKAHYRRNDASINLTRDKGDGSLAHEWWHALDNYFMRQHADNPLMMTSDAQKEVVPQVMNAEAAESFLALMRALRSGSYYTRAKLYDDTTNSKGYWDSIVEMGARAFQCYVAEKVREDGLNDYLSSYISKEEFARMDAAFEKGMNESRYPYPTAEELKDLRPMFDKFFSSLTHKEGEGGNLVTFSEEVDEEDDEISMQPGESEANFAERVSIMNRAKSNGTWLKAPNGKQSNLTPQQWTMVRTGSFKERFGDWERAALLTFADTEYTNEQCANALEAEAATPFYNEESKVTALISSTQRSKITSGVAQRKSIASGFSTGSHNYIAAHIRNLFWYAVKIGDYNDRLNDPNILSIKRYACPIIIKGESAYAYMTVKESKIHGHRIYSLELNTIKKLEGNLDEHLKDMRHPSPSAEIVTWLHNVSKTFFEDFSNTLDENGEPVLDNTKFTLSTHSLALDDAALDGMPDLQEDVVQDLLGAVRREISRLNRVFTGNGGSDVAARELGQIAALMKQVYCRCDKNHRAAVLPRVRVVDALGKMLRNGRVYTDALTKAELEELKQQMQDEEGLLAGGFAVEESVDEAGNVTLRRAGRDADALRDARALLVREFAGRKMDMVARTMLTEAAAALEAQERDAIAERMVAMTETLLPQKDKHTHKMKKGKMSANAERRLMKLYEMMTAKEKQKVEAMESLNALKTSEENKPDPDAARVDSLTEELEDWAVLGALSGLSLAQIRRAEEALADFVTTERTAWSDKLEGERKRLRRVAHDAERALGKADASTLRELAEREQKTRYAFGALAENLMSLSQAFTAMSGLPGMEELGQDGVKVLRDGHRDLKRREDAVSNALADFMRDKLKLTSDKEQAKFMVKLRETMKTQIVRQKVCRKVVEMSIEEAQSWLDLSREEREERRRELEAAAEERGEATENVPEEADIPLMREQVQKALQPGTRKDGRAKAVRRKNVRTEREWTEEQPALVASRDQLLNALLTYEQPSYEENARVNGYTPEVLEEIRKAVGADVLAFGYFMRDLLERSGLANEYEAREGVPFPAETNYWPGKFRASTRMNQNVDALNAQMGSGSKHGMLITRVKHNEEVDLSLGATNVFLSGYAQANNYIVFGAFTSKWRRLLAHRGFAAALNQKLGNNRFIAIKQMLDLLDGAGVAEAVTQRSTSFLMRMLQSGKSVAVLSGNLLTLAKQWTAAFNGAAYVSPATLCAQLLLDRVGGGKMGFFKMLETDVFQERYKDNRPFVELMKRRESDMKWSALSGWARAGMDAIEKMDVWANCVGMTALYNVEYRRLQQENKGVADGMSEDEIHDHCMELVATALDQVAQPQRATQRSMMSALGRNNLFVMMSCYMRTDVLNKLGMAVATYERERAKGVGAVRALLKGWAYVATLSAAEQLLVAIWERLQGQTPDDDEKTAWLVSRMLMGLSGAGIINGMPLLGGAVDAVKQISSGNRWFPSNQLDDTFLDVQGWTRFGKMPWKSLSGEKEYTAAEWAVWTTDAARRAVQFLGLAGGLTSRTRWVSELSGFLQSTVTATNAVRPFALRTKNVEKAEEKERKKNARKW